MKKAVIIPAVKKNVIFYDDLIKKLAGESLIKRVIEKALKIAPKEDIYLITDSEEIRLICKRNGIQYFFDHTLELKLEALIEGLESHLSSIADKYQVLLLLSPYAPLLKVEEIQKALKQFESDKGELLVTVKRGVSRVFTASRKSVNEILNGEVTREVLIESHAFQIINSALIKNKKPDAAVHPLVYELDHDLLEIQSYQDWWVCEKLLKRKRIVFHVIGDEQVGMGHIQRALTLAHEITDHEIRFVCEEKSKVAADRLAGYDYWLEICRPEEIEGQILALEPDLVINDILDSDPEYIRKLRASNIPVINFEDLGEGAGLANITINELYDEPLFPGENILWGQNYFFVREEFNDAIPNKFKNKVDSILILFGGTDPSDYTRKVLHSVKDYCTKEKIKIYILTGGGYPFIKELGEEIDRIKDTEIEYEHSIGVVSHIMEQVQVAISSNGRTAYELAHMNIPSIILSHHEREKSHKFTREENGFIPLGLYQELETEEKVLTSLKRLAQDHDYRETLYQRLEPLQFIKSKDKVIKMILDLLEHQ
jgi:spore coat polysaccharide biosynthesis predicted glycosyltransferase SpsG/CMP-N-acetylneuraminic acid synthetase